MVSWSLEQAYEAYPRIEREFSQELGRSLDPRGPGQLFDLVAGFGLAEGAAVIDVGCGEGWHAVQLAGRFGLSVTGIDPVPRHIEAARAAAGAAGPVFTLGTAEQIPAADATADLVWCRDVLVHVPGLAGAYAEFHRVLKPGGRALVYQMFGTPLLEPREAAWLWGTMGVVPASADPARTEEAIAAAGLRVDQRVVVGTEWGEWAAEHRGQGDSKLLHTSRLLRGREGYVARFGQAAYDMMLGDCLWHIYAMIGKLERRVYVLSRPGTR
jgi:SAM-dependent methyltransferase